MWPIFVTNRDWHYKNSIFLSLILLCSWPETIGPGSVLQLPKPKKGFRKLLFPARESRILQLLAAIGLHRFAARGVPVREHLPKLAPKRSARQEFQNARAVIPWVSHQG